MRTWLLCLTTLLAASCKVSIDDEDGDAAGDDPAARAVLTDADALEVSCEAGSFSDCTKLGRLYKQGEGVEADLARAVELFSLACTGNDARGCTALGLHHERGDGVERDLAKAASLYKQGCDGGASRGCAELGRLTLDGLGVPQDVDAAVELHKKACRGGMGESCSELASLFELGARVPRNPERSRRFAQRGCNKEHALSCVQLARRQVLAGDDKDAREVLSEMLKWDADKLDIDLTIVHGLRLLAGEKAKDVAEPLVAAWRTRPEKATEWSWAPLKEPLQDDRRNRSKDLLVVLNLLDTAPGEANERALRTALEAAK